MKCLNPKCGYLKTRVINTRDKGDDKYVLRRRVCPKCRLRYSSIEVLAYFDCPNKKNRYLIYTHYTSNREIEKL